jgi:hypothetical protein
MECVNAYSMFMRINYRKNLRGGGGGGGFGPIPESWMQKEQLFHYSPYFQLGMKRQQDLGGSEVAEFFTTCECPALRTFAGQYRVAEQSPRDDPRLRPTFQPRVSQLSNPA